MRPTNRDLAQFAIAALEFDLVELSNIIAWGDEVIVNTDEPPTWAFDLSMASNLEEAGETLRRFEWLPGELTPVMTERLIVGLLRRRWLSSSVDFLRAESILWELQLLGGEEQLYRQFIDIELVRRLHYREYMEEFPHCDDIPWQLNQIFSSCEALDQLLPDWV